MRHRTYGGVRGRGRKAPPTRFTGSLPLNIPVHLMHGTEDSDVPWEESFCLLQKAHTQNARLTLIKGGDHRLSRQEDLAALCAAVEQMTVYT